MSELDAFLVRGHEKVIEHYRRLRDSSSSDEERRALQARIDRELSALSRYAPAEQRRAA
ncbi:hypothetical protein JQ634_32880 [Bradyrhizobium sp. AUGA SZCCT0240]|jgi:hypothetical protein|uniref:hypothetical protein n=1 Tax=unclassified Bradyrhizobium TaxID=2631580 RepID=UPI001BAA1AB5|nr:MULTISPECIES: hypothetical protein [unclassified Bradyrhizobium]MBR1200485.1 hypothetical protein [Bradyrhizobium sp. AUGA SZCCT0158]MBR1242521.1 hypothetical protein [Bradyrhizobium sp. AUGA SZCCT0274]MBR1249689.1 hypothetical protein [Bradyrhizobium sp. AUGA SZCCT0169]MBR1258453.1 hypothetical protein [Bradyrhizobium sp. AUGA SZCCT0240]